MPEDHGDKLELAREIDHWAYFPSASSRDAYVTDAIQLGFALRIATSAEAQDEKHGAQLWRADVPSYKIIDDITMPLFNLAAKHGGEYDGWECAVVT